MVHGKTETAHQVVGDARTAQPLKVPLQEMNVFIRGFHTAPTSNG